MSHVCVYCKAKKYTFESDGLCCSAGKIKLPLPSDPPQPLKNLLSGNSKMSKSFFKHIRHYNSAFQMTSFGVSKLALQPGFMSTFRIQGQVCHRIGSLIPETGKKPEFLQIYFVGSTEKECDIRCDITSDLDKDVVRDLQNMLHRENDLIKVFKTAIEHKNNTSNLKVVINSEKRPVGEHSRRYNQPTCKDVAVVLIDEGHGPRDIVVNLRGEGLKSVSESHRSYDSLQYPLIIWQGQDGYHFNIPQVFPSTGLPNFAKKVSCSDFYAYMIMIREGTTNYLLQYRELFLQFLVAMYAKELKE